MNIRVYGHYGPKNKLGIWEVKLFTKFDYYKIKQEIETDEEIKLNRMMVRVK